MKKDQKFKGFETWYTDLQMNLKMVVYIIFPTLLLQVLITLAVSYVWHGEAWRLIFEYTWEKLKAFSMPDMQLLGNTLNILARQSLWIFFLTFFLWIFLPIVFGKFKRRAKRQAEDRYIRGAQMLTARELQHRIYWNDEKVYIGIGEVKMPISAEPKHMFVIGRPGTGKTVAMRQVIEDIRKRGNKAVIYDFKGDYLCKFFDPSTDIIFNPLDARCVGWNVFNEADTTMDIVSIATSLISPSVAATDPFWNDAARDVFIGILHYLYQQEKRTNADIWQTVTAPTFDIAKWLKGTRGGEAGHKHIEDAGSKQAMSVISVLMQYARAFEYLAGTQGDFSLKKWIEGDKGGWVFVTSYADIKATLRPILSLFVDLLGRKLLALPNDYDRRIFFFLDEFGTLQRLSTIQDLLTLSRSKGGSVWLGIQDIGQLDKTYTPAGRQTIVNACGSNLIFSVADPDTARFLSEKIGDIEYSEAEESRSMGVEDQKDGINISRRKQTKKLMLPSQIQTLKDLHGVLKFPNYDYAETVLEYKNYKDVADSFVCRADLNLSNIAQQEGVIGDEEKEIEGRERGKKDRDRAIEAEF